MNQNIISGSPRQSHTTPQGLYLERGYVYLTPDAWQNLYTASRSAGLSASLYIASLIQADNGKSIEGTNNDRTRANN